MHNSQSGDTSGINTLPRINTSNFRNSIHKIWRGTEYNIGDTILDDARDTDIVILIMGPTGVGKSTFINAAAGSDSAVNVGHELESCTAAIRHAIVPHPRKEDPRRFIFVDTPGFDDTYVDDSEILRRILVWLARSYSDRVRLAGAIYMHEISQTRFLDISRKNLGMFTKLIGDDAAKNVILATTKWGDVEKDVGERREEQLRANFWKDMINQGSRTAQFHNTYESAWAIINLIVDDNPVDALQIKNELVQLEKLIPETEAGQTLHATENKGRKGDDGLQEHFQELKVPLGKRIIGWFNLREPSVQNLET
ncbi:P-loop containing nucleoside triphosphate hydrolase protein [Hygrophoropsis aurantiaca]|uniref:P-loop containing nucleoside triphosphate hydrolase protein n=1 Tax=Hygrophoropsis aurantiaca TaxID=72124 RepID=A0ACB8A181_9AGAM|nr:P-loop containing nucleoside triphosphate hydrolase protein [Hygrophoropsis aurantiaca]